MSHILINYSIFVKRYGAPEYPIYFMGWMIWIRSSTRDRGKRLSIFQ
jgi:hypothetical protein